MVVFRVKSGLGGPNRHRSLTIMPEIGCNICPKRQLESFEGKNEVDTVWWFEARVHEGVNRPLLRVDSVFGLSLGLPFNPWYRKAKLLF